MAWRVYDSIEPINRFRRIEELIGTIAYYFSMFVEFRGRKPEHEDFVDDPWRKRDRRIPANESRVNLFASLGAPDPKAQVNGK